YSIAASLLAAPDLRRALGTFTPYAVAAGVVVAGTGIVNAILELANPADLVETGYGLVLLAKSAAFVAMASLGLLHFLWRRRPRVPEAAVRRPLRVEAVVATVALVLATLLVGFPNPPREAGATADELTTTDPVLAELGDRDALSVADASGPFVVGLTILPPKPGSAEVRVQVLGVDPGDGLRNARVTGSSGSATVDVPLEGRVAWVASPAMPPSRRPVIGASRSRSTRTVVRSRSRRPFRYRRPTAHSPSAGRSPPRRA